MRAVALRTGCPSFFLAPARFPRASRSPSSRWSWRSAPAVQHGPSDPARCAPPRSRLRPGVPSRPPSAQPRTVGAALLHLVCPGRGVRGVLVALARIPSPPGWLFAGAPASSHPSMNGTSVAGVRGRGFRGTGKVPSAPLRRLSGITKPSVQPLARAPC